MGGGVALVTGSNTGIGLEIVRGIAGHGIKTILTARNAEKGQQATKLLHEQGMENVEFHELDVTSSESVASFTTWIKNTFGHLDILVNNAGIGYGSEKAIVETNFYGAKRMTEAMVPLMNHPGARIINISAVGSRLDMLVNKEWQKRLLNENNSLTEEMLDSFVSEYLTQMSNGGDRSEWILEDSSLAANNSISKMALSSYARLLAEKLSSSGVSVYCMCPGHTSSKSTFNTGHSAAIGADTAVWLATAPPSSDISSGSFYVNRTKVSFLRIPLFTEDGKLLFDLSDLLEIRRAFLKNYVEEKSAT